MTSWRMMRRRTKRRSRGARRSRAFLLVSLNTIWRQIFEEHNFRGFRGWVFNRENCAPRKLGTDPSMNSTTYLLRYFSTVSADQKLQDPQGALARDVPSSVISAANTEVKRMQNEQQPTSKSKRESYAKFTDGQKVERKDPDDSWFPFATHFLPNSGFPHVLLDMIAAHHRLHAKPFACYVTFPPVEAPRSAPSKPSGLK